ncbi:ISL3 family transposase, partial [Enterococcus avium]
LKQYPLFQRKYLTESEVLDYLLSIDKHLRTSYDVYQNLLDAFDAKDYTDFYERIDHLPPMLDPAFKKAILYLN